VLPWVVHQEDRTILKGQPERAINGVRTLNTHLMGASGDFLYPIVVLQDHEVVVIPSKVLRYLIYLFSRCLHDYSPFEVYLNI